MAKQYTVLSDPVGGPLTPATGRHSAKGRELGERHWRLLALVAERGVLDTQQITTLMFDSRPTAARHLSALVKAGLLRRFVNPRDPTHLAHYEISNAGADLLRQRLRDANQPEPLGLGQRGHADEPVVNDFFLRLAAHARRTGHGHLYRWRHALDAAAWLRSHRIMDIGARGHGIWIEDNLAVGFLLHLDHDRPSPLAGSLPAEPAALLTGYQQATAGVPVDVALVITTTTQRERRLHLDIRRLRLPVRVGATTVDRLHEAASPAEAIWSTTGAEGLTRLVDLARQHGGLPQYHEASGKRGA